MNYRTIGILLTVFIAFVACYVATSNRELAGDDMLYSFVFDDSRFMDSQALTPIESFDDVIKSQIWHYFNFNGRLPVHIVVQAFAGLLGLKAFALVNSAVYICFLYLFIGLAFGREGRKNPWVWLLSLLIVHYCFSGGINTSMGPWFAIAMGVNYLWAGTMFLWVLTLVQQRPLYPVAIFSGFFAGWSNEAFAVPLAGGLVLYYLFCVRSVPEKSRLALLIALLAGTALCCFAPATLNRGRMVSSFGLGYTIYTLVECYSQLVFIYLLVVSLLIAALRRKKGLTEYLRVNTLLVIVLGVGLLFSVIAHTDPHSLTCVELVSLILLIRLLNTGFHFSGAYGTTASRILFTICCMLFIGHQYAIAMANQRALTEYKNVANRFKESPSGLVWSDYPVESMLVSPFVDVYRAPFGPGNNWGIPFAVLNGERKRRPLELSLSDYQLLASGLDNARRINGSAGLYEGEEWYFAKKTDGILPDKVVISYDGDYFANLPNLTRMLCRFLWPVKTPVESEVFSARTPFGEYYLVKKHNFIASSIDRSAG